MTVIWMVMGSIGDLQREGLWQGKGRGQGSHRIREDNGGEGLPGMGGGSRRYGMVWGNGRFGNRPYQMVVRGNEGMGPRIREDNGVEGSDE